MRSAIAIITLFILTIFSVDSFAQESSLTGTIKGSSSEALIGATISLKAQDGTVVSGSVTDMDGKFEITGIKPGIYKLEVNSLGFEDVERDINILGSTLDAGLIQMKESQTRLKEVTITGRTPPVQQKDDTTQYNASSYKTNPDANAEDLLRKMPGFDMSSGSAKAQGETVAKVLVDGKPFFGDDATSSLRNLPAEVIERIQVYDEKSEQSQFTGFDDGNTSKTINIVTKPGRRQGLFGKVYAGYGTNERYNLGGNLNYFEGDRRLSIIGQSNNINIQNFAAQDLVGVSGSSGGRGGGARGGGSMGGGGRQGGPGGRGGDATSNFMVNQQGGISRTNAVGFNYSDKWGKKVDVTASYFFNNSNNVSDQQTSRQYVLPNQAGQTYDDNSNAVTENFNHRFNMRLNYTIDSSNSILFIPNISIQDNKGRSSMSGQTLLNGNTLLNSTVNNYQSNLSGLNATAMLLYRHKFKKQGRTFSIHANGGYNQNDGDNKFFADNTYEDASKNEQIDQISELQKQGWNINTNVNYTEPLSKKSFLQIQYGLNYQESESQKETYDFNSGDNGYTSLNSLLSNSFTTNYLTNKGGLSYRFSDSMMNFNIGLNYQYADLTNARTLPVNFNLQRNFSNILPSAMFMYRFSKRQNLRLFYRTSTDAPTVDQLQDVVDNTNPLQLTSGNPDLIQAYQHRLNMMYSSSNTERASTFFAMLSGTYTQDYIANNTFVAQVPTTIRGVDLETGQQFTRPVNMDGYANVRSFATYGFPVKAIKSNLNINASAGYSRTPGMVNEAVNYAGNTNAGLGLVLSSNISENFDFTISSNSTMNFVQNSLNTATDNRFFNQSSRLSLNYIFWKGIVFNTELNHQLYSGLSAGFNQNFLLWNMSVAKKVFKNQQGEIKLSVYDLLKQNNSIQRTITELYSQDVRTNVLQQYFMVTFTYNLRFFKGGATMKDVENKGGNMPPDGPPHFMR